MIAWLRRLRGSGLERIPDLWEFCVENGLVHVDFETYWKPDRKGYLESPRVVARDYTEDLVVEYSQRLIDTNPYLVDPVVRADILLRSAVGSAKIEGIRGARKRLNQRD